MNKAKCEKLQCQWISWEVTGINELTVTIAENNSPDMDGTIEIAKVLCPRVWLITVKTVGLASGLCYMHNKWKRTWAAYDETPCAD